MTASKQSRLIVVDTCVARSAGEEEKGPSARCAKFLRAVLTICHRVVMTREILDQWQKRRREDERKKYKSKVTHGWLSSMYARKKVVLCEGIELSHVDEACAMLSATEQRLLREDLLLIEAACAADWIVVTTDQRIVTIWCKCQDRLGLRRPIKWINPETDSVETLEHL